MQLSFFFFLLLFRAPQNLLSAATKLTNANVVSVRGCGIDSAEQQAIAKSWQKTSQKLRALQNILCKHSCERSQNLGILFKHSFYSNKHYSFLYIQSTRQYVCYPELTSIYRSCAQLTLSTAYAAPYSQFLFSHSPRNARDHTRSSRKYHSQENSNSDQTPRTDGDTEWHPHVHN